DPHGPEASTRSIACIRRPGPPARTPFFVVAGHAGGPPHSMRVGGAYAEHDDDEWRELGVVGAPDRPGPGAIPGRARQVLQPAHRLGEVSGPAGGKGAGG